MNPLTHFDAQGQAHMVDVGMKAHSHRVAVAGGRIEMLPATLAIIEGGTRRSRGACERPSSERCQDLLRGSDHQLDDRADQRHPAGSDERTTQTSGSELPPRRI